MRAPYDDGEPDESATQALAIVEASAPAPAFTPAPEMLAAMPTPGVVAIPAPSGPRHAMPSEASLLRYALTLFGFASSVGLLFSVGLAFPSVQWLPWLIGTVVYGVLGVRMWIAQQEHERTQDALARQRVDNAGRQRLQLPAPGLIDEAGGWRDGR